MTALLVQAFVTSMQTASTHRAAVIVSAAMAGLALVVHVRISMNVKCPDDVNNSQTQCVTTHLVALPVLVLSVMARCLLVRAVKTSMNVNVELTDAMQTQFVLILQVDICATVAVGLLEMASLVKISMNVKFNQTFVLNRTTQCVQIQLDPIAVIA